MTTNDLLTIHEAATRLGVSDTTVYAACRQGRVQGASREARPYGVSVGPWLVPASVIAPLRKDSAGRVIWSSARLKPGPNQTTGKSRSPRCACCGILLQESGDLGHPADTEDAGECWWCKETRGKLSQMAAIITGM